MGVAILFFCVDALMLYNHGKAYQVIFKDFKEVVVENCGVKK